MADQLKARAQRAASVLAPFMGIFLIVIQGKRW